METRGPSLDKNRGERNSQLTITLSALSLLVRFFFTGTRTIAVVKGSEDYATIAESFKEVFQEINEVQADGFVEVGEEKIPVELFLGGDYKVSSTLL